MRLLINHLPGAAGDAENFVTHVHVEKRGEDGKFERSHKHVVKAGEFVELHVAEGTQLVVHRAHVSDE